MTNNIVAVFPLPNVVFFPGTNLPLHIFEPRYCEMVRETLANKQYIGMFLLQPGWETDYYGNPPIFQVGCAGELVFVENLPDARFNIVLKGVHRVRALEEVQENPYRKARVEVIPEVLPDNSLKIQSLRTSLLSTYRGITAENTKLEEILDFSSFVNTLACTLQLDLETKFRLLQEDDVVARASELQEILKHQSALVDWTSRFGHLRPSDPSIN